MSISSGGGGTRPRQSAEDVVFDTVTTLLMGAACLVILYPIYFIVIASLSDPDYVLSGRVAFWPKGLNLDGYKRILRYTPLWQGYVNSIYYSVAGALLSSACTLFAAYPLSRPGFSGKKPFTALLLIAMFFSGGLIPQYILINALGLRNTRIVLILMTMASTTNIFIASSYFRTTNVDSLFEASQIDGCTHFGYFFKILLPISTPIVIVMLLFYGVGQWNDYFRAMIYLDSHELYPIQLVLKELLATTQITGSIVELLSEDREAYEEMIRAAESMKYGIIIFASLPMLIVYLFLQKYFVQGITLGSVKE